MVQSMHEVIQQSNRTRFLYLIDDEGDQFRHTGLNTLPYWQNPPQNC